MQSMFQKHLALCLLPVFAGILLGGCASTHKTHPAASAAADATPVPTPPPEPAVESCLAEGAARFQFPDAPALLTLLDVAKVEYTKDGGFRVVVRSLWAARTQPPKGFPAPIRFNSKLQKIESVRVRTWSLTKDGRFAPDEGVTVEAKPFLENAPPGLECLQTVDLPPLQSGKAMELTYTLSNLPAPTLAEAAANSLPAAAAERSFAFRWQGAWPALKRELVLTRPVSLKIYGYKARLPEGVKVYEKTEDQTAETTWLLDGYQGGVETEPYQPPLNDFTGVTSFSASPDWETALQPFLDDCARALEAVKGVSLPLTDADGNTPTALSREEQARNLVNRLRAQWKIVDSGLPISLQPRRPLETALESRVLTPRESALVLAASLRIVGLRPHVYLAHRPAGGALLTQSPSLQQFDQALIGWESDKDFTWVDPSEPLAPAGSLPPALLDIPALDVARPVKWRNTPAMLARDHRKERNVELDIRADGSLACRVEMEAFGSSEVALRQFFRDTTDAQRRDVVSRGLIRRFPKAKLVDYNAGDYRDLGQPFIVKYGFEVPDFASWDRQGRMAFYPPVFEDVEDFLSALRDNRRNALVLPQNFNSTVREIIRLPKGWAVKDLPETGTLSNAVAEFMAEPKISFGTLIYERYTGIKDRVIAPGPEYKQLLAFYQAVLKQDRTPFYAEKTAAPVKPKPAKRSPAPAGAPYKTKGVR